MKWRLKIYQVLVNRVPAIRKKYHSIRQQKKGPAGRVYAWAALLAMNLTVIFNKSRYEADFYFPDSKKKVPAKTGESALSVRETPKQFARRLSEYDVISFDVFDTLVFRPVSNPPDLFFVVGGKLGYLDFKRIRMEMEWRARQKAKAEKDSYEVTLKDIYRQMEEQAGIPLEKGMQAETETEMQYCFANPYMLEVYELLRTRKKKIVCTTDMYLPEDIIRAILEKCGYSGIHKIFLSCALGASKADGGLYKKVKEEMGQNFRYVHVGDNPVSDVEMAKKNGFAAEFYQNVNIAGMPYRAEDMSMLPGCFYRGIVNTHIHNGLQQYSREYELGFIYGGLFVMGYVRWIHEYAVSHRMDKILFFSRDGDILHRAHKMLYSGENAEYVYWSRLAAAKMTARYFKQDYFRRFLEHKVNQGYELKDIFRSMEIEDMLPEMCKKLPEFIETGGQFGNFYGQYSRHAFDVRKEAAVTEKTKLTDKNVWMIKEYLNANWQSVLVHYEEQSEAGKQYYKEVLKDCRKACAVDIGWAGSGAIALDFLVNREWKLGCEITGLVAGTNTLHNAEPDMSEPQLHNGKLESYLYSANHNRNLWKFHDAGKGHNLVWEGLLASAQGSFKGFYIRNDKVILKFKEPDVEEEKVMQLQQGIFDFIRCFATCFPDWKSTVQLSGADAYAPVKLLLNPVNRDYIKEMQKEFEQEMNVE